MASRYTENEKEYRKELHRHMNSHHGGYRAEQGDRLSVEMLEDVHKILHEDRYACPPHEHGGSKPYEVGEIQLTLGDNYLSEVKAAARGE